jgi:hypothetical protein
MNYKIEKENKDYVMVKAIPENDGDRKVLTMLNDQEVKHDNDELKSVLNEAGNLVRANGFKVIQVDIPENNIFPVKIQPKYY